MSKHGKLRKAMQDVAERRLEETGTIYGEMLRRRRLIDESIEPYGHKDDRFRDLKSTLLTAALVTALILSTPVMPVATRQSLPDWAANAEKVDPTGNWAGYVVKPSGTEKGKVTGVSGSWVVQEPILPFNTTTHNTYAEGDNWFFKTPLLTHGPHARSTSLAQWIGIGGQGGDSTLIQVCSESFYRVVGTIRQLNAPDGKDKEDSFGMENFALVYEMLPGPPIRIRAPVEAGDTVAASITLVDPERDRWRIWIANLSRMEEFCDTVTYRSGRSSADFINEVPDSATAGMATFQSLYGKFGKAYTGSLENEVEIAGKKYLLADLDRMVEVMAPPAARPCLLVFPSDLTGSSFTVAARLMLEQ